VNWDPREHYKDLRVAEAYDRTRFSGLAGWTFDRLERRALLRALRDLPAGSEIIDIPCGTGRLAQAMLGAGHHVTGIDISQAMLDEAVKKLAPFGTRFTTKLGDAMRLPSPEQPFGAAVCARILMHLPLDQQIEFLRGVARQTRGVVVFNQSYNSGYQRTRRRIKRLLGHPASVAYPLSETDIERLLNGAQLREIRRLWVAPPVSEAFILVAVKK
jgi:ubiquinone/menaquinone biosynthesis C-methylase UbiE